MLSVKYHCRRVELLYVSYLLEKIVIILKYLPSQTDILDN